MGGSTGAIPSNAPAQVLAPDGQQIHPFVGNFVGLPVSIRVRNSFFKNDLRW